MKSVRDLYCSTSGETSDAGKFLLRHHMHYSQIDMEKELDRFLHEMDQLRSGALSVNEHTIKMIPSFFGTFQKPASPVSVTVIDIGGTNVRSAVVTFDPAKGLSIDRQAAFLTPGVEHETDTAHFFREIAEGVRGNLDTQHIGICFSLATIPQPDRDAVMCAGGKQIRIRDMIGKKVGQSFREALQYLGLPSDARITVVNDTVSAALGGQLEETADNNDHTGAIGFIYGTGTNLCYREPDTGHIINVESGAYCGFPTGDIDDLYDRNMIDPGQDRFEKMVSGGYQGGLVTCLLHAAAAEGEISAETVRRILSARPGAIPSTEFTSKDSASTDSASEESAPKDLTSKDISEFSYDPCGTGRIASACLSDKDRAFLCDLFDGMTRRSACLCAVTITAALLRAGAGRSSSRPAFITAEGSTFEKQKDFRSMLEAFLQDLAAGRHHLSYKIHVVPHAVIKGIAIACLSE